MKEVERQRDEAEEKNEILNQDKQIFTVLEESVSQLKKRQKKHQQEVARVMEEKKELEALVAEFNADREQKRSLV